MEAAFNDVMEGNPNMTIRSTLLLSAALGAMLTLAAPFGAAAADAGGGSP